MHSVLRALNQARDRLGKAGIEAPRLNAEVVLSNVLGLDRAVLYARFQEALSAEQLDEFGALVGRRAAGEPLQYLVGRCEFFGREFAVTPAVMVPRMETELLVEKCLEKLPAPAEGVLAADVGTGSGVIAVTLAAERPALQLIATDLSADALVVADGNARAHGVAERIRFVEGDLAAPLLELLPAEREGMDLIACNPPYIPTGVIEQLRPEVRDHEPRSALDGGPDGLSVIRRLTPQAANALRPGGCLVLELGEGQADRVKKLVRQAAFDMTTVETAKDVAGCERVLCVSRPAP